MNQESLSIGQAINDGWNGLKEFPGPAIGGFLVVWVISFVLGLIPIINIINSFFIAPAFTGGIAILFLKLKDRNNPKLANVFDGFSQYGRFLGLFWLIFLIMLGGMIPGGILLGIGAAVESTALMVIGSIIVLVVVIILAIRLCFSFLLAADTKLKAAECIKKSMELTKGYRTKIFLWGLVAYGIILLGLLCLGFGVFAASPIVMISLASLYRQRAGEKEPVQGEQKPAPEEVKK